MVHIDLEQVNKVAEHIKQIPPIDTLDFVSPTDMYPPVNHPHALNFFFFVCMHQFGFWYANKEGYIKPAYDTLNGKQEKGSTLLWKLARRVLDTHTELFEPHNLVSMAPKEFEAFFFTGDTKTSVSFPNILNRIELTRQYCLWFRKAQTTPAQLIKRANKTLTPATTLINVLTDIPGYSGDSPFNKKAWLLVMALSQRPEYFLHAKEKEHLIPIIDYHVMRVLLRLGCIVFTDIHAQMKNINRVFVAKNEENTVRKMALEVCNSLITKTGRSMPEIDVLLWQARQYCPEMEQPNCQECIFTTVCKKQTELFQPVYRTTAY
jgi:hypothetical protein